MHYVTNLHGLDYETEWLEHSDLETLLLQPHILSAAHTTPAIVCTDGRYAMRCKEIAAHSSP